MGWSGRAPALPASQPGKGHNQRSTAIDIGKNSFHVVGLDQRGAIVLRQKWSRGRSNVGKEKLGDIARSTADLDPAEIDFSNAIRTRL
jgi:hypothetical protein